MADKTGIEWTDATWNPIVGCSVVSPGCTNCYAMKQAARIERMHDGLHAKAGCGAPFSPSHYAGLTQETKAGPVWTGGVAQASEHSLTQPLRWKRPRRIFVNSMGDLFHESAPDAWIDRVFAVMALAPQHTFQVLTKRAKRMRDYLEKSQGCVNGAIWSLLGTPAGSKIEHGGDWRKALPLSNVWLGVSAEDQTRADERIPDLLATPAAVRFVSAEPLLGEIDFEAAWAGESALGGDCWGECAWCKKGFPPLHNCQNGRQTEAESNKDRSGLDWVIVGGESGPNARPMHPDWARTIRDQCVADGVPFFFKQWGEFASVSEVDGTGSHHHFPDGATVRRIGKARAGRLLDGREHNAFPSPAGA